jgi:hypothetical protein
VSTSTTITPVAGSAAIQAAPAAPLTADQQRLLSYFNRLDRASQEYILGHAEDVAALIQSRAPKPRAFRVISGGAS